MNIGPAIRTRLLAQPALVALLGQWHGEPSIHTRRPPPEGAGYPMVMIGPDVAHTDIGFLAAAKSRVLRDIIVYGDNPKHYRAVEQAGYLVREAFHRRKDSILLAGYHTIDVLAEGPVPAPTDDDSRVGRRVTIAVRIEPRT